MCRRAASKESFLLTFPHSVCISTLHEQGLFMKCCLQILLCLAAIPNTSGSPNVCAMDCCSYGPVEQASCCINEEFCSLISPFTSRNRPCDQPCCSTLEDFKAITAQGSDNWTLFRTKCVSVEAVCVSVAHRALALKPTMRCRLTRTHLRMCVFLC